MKSKFTTSLALIAVLLTGTAAAAVNTQALNGPTQSTLAAGAATLLPVNNSVAISPGQPEIITVSPSQSSDSGLTPNQVTETTQSPNGVSSTSNKNAPTKSSLVFANPNPTSGEDDEDQEDEEDEDDEDDEDQEEEDEEDEEDD